MNNPTCANHLPLAVSHTIPKESQLHLFFFNCDQRKTE